MKPHLDYSLKDFLEDDNFIRYAFGGRASDTQEWDFCSQSTDFKLLARLAKDILCGKILPEELPPAESEQLKTRIFDSLMLS